MEQTIDLSDTIAAPATPAGGALSIIRLSGPDALAIADKVWRGRKPLHQTRPNTACHGWIHDGQGRDLDEAVATAYRAPRSFTGQDSVEFTIHGSPWIASAVMQALTEAGARVALPGEFTQRSFLNGRMDLTRAEGIADLIASSSRAAHTLAISQTRGDFARRFTLLRDDLIHLASMLELELDFSEEEVEFADRGALIRLCDDTIREIDALAGSYATGRVLKEGVPVVIAGHPNAGKSTLLNYLVGDDKAIVSDIPGTTRDIIEDTAEIDGILYRFIDTAGLRGNTDDPIESIGIDRARAALVKARIILWLRDPATDTQPEDIPEINGDQTLIRILTKSDLHPGRETPEGWLALSSKDPATLQQLKRRLKESVLRDHDPAQTLIITNARHHAALRQVSAALTDASGALKAQESADLVSQHIRRAIHHLGLLTGAITPDDLLQNIFSHFCIGK